MSGFNRSLNLEQILDIGIYPHNHHKIIKIRIIQLAFGTFAIHLPTAGRTVVAHWFQQMVESLIKNLVQSKSG